ncbi:MAG: hypothetical protein ACYTG6_13420 [Planctomycetota bacterium]|jgi:hypothetical protein
MRRTVPLVVAALSLALAPVSRAEEDAPPPLAHGVRVTLAPERTTYEIGEPILIAIRHLNEGERTWRVEEDHFGTFHDAFVVTDGDGAPVPNPFALDGPFEGNGPVTRHELGPGDEVVVERMLNECVLFDRPGRYRVEPRAPVYEASDEGGRRTYRCETEGVELVLRDFHVLERARTMQALLDAHGAGGPLPDDLPVDRKYVFNASRMGIVRLLAFYAAPDLVPFFLDVIEDEDWNGYAANGLTAMRDREPVLRAFEARLEAAAEHGASKLFYVYERLAVPIPLDAPLELRRRRLEERRLLRARYLPAGDR